MRCEGSKNANSGEEIAEMKKRKKWQIERAKERERERASERERERERAKEEGDSEWSDRALIAAVSVAVVCA